MPQSTLQQKLWKFKNQAFWRVDIIVEYFSGYSGKKYNSWAVQQLNKKKNSFNFFGVELQSNNRIWKEVQLYNLTCKK